MHTAQVLKLVRPDAPGEPWTIEVRCPFCSRKHGHGLGADIANPLLGSRVSDCQPGGVYEIGALPAPSRKKR